MRQPVAGILMLAQGALAQRGLPCTVRARLGQIIGQAEWLRDMIEQSLLAGEPAERCVPTDLARLVSEAAAGYSVTHRGVIEVAQPAVPVLAQVNRVVLGRIIGNLLSNATRAAGPGGTVAVTVGRQEGWPLLAVEDSGPGFGAIEGGLGLGLNAVARSVVSRGGRFESGPSILGGARVSLLLPPDVG